MVKATLEKEICIETPDSKGTAAKLTQLVASQAKANIRSAWAAGNSGNGHFSLITDNNAKVIEALKSDYPKCKESEVLVLGMNNGLGDIADITGKISKADLNIDFIYTTYFDNKPALIVSTNNNKKAFELFN